MIEIQIIIDIMMLLELNNSLDKSTTSTGSGQRSPLSSASDKSCDEQLLLMQQQQQQRSMYIQHQQQQASLGR